MQGEQMKPSHMRLIEEIRTELHTYPELAAHITEAMTAGLKECAQLNKQHASDMETVAAMSLNARLFKGQESYIASLIRKWSHKNTIKWDDVLTKLEKNK
jgi:hypothetical protein